MWQAASLLGPSGWAGPTHAGGDDDPARKTARSLQLPCQGVTGHLAALPMQHKLLLLSSPRLVSTVTQFSILRH